MAEKIVDAAGLGFDDSLDNKMEMKEEQDDEQASLDAIPPQRKPHKHVSDIVLEPVNHIHMLLCQERKIPPDMRESIAVPVVPDMKKAEDDYNSIDYQIIAMNLWKNTSRELV